MFVVSGGETYQYVMSETEERTGNDGGKMAPS